MAASAFIQAGNGRFRPDAFIGRVATILVTDETSLLFRVPKISSFRLMSLSHIALAALAGLLCAAVLLFAAGEAASRPTTRLIGPPPSDFPARVVTLPGPFGGSVSGWFAPGQPGKGAVLLLHGVRSDRAQMLRRARFLNHAGYAALLIDLPAHGESSGDRVTFGAREASGVVAALDYMRRELPSERIGIIGVSMGAASTVLAHPKPAPDAIVLESMYPTIDDALANRLRMRFGPIGASLAPLLLWQLPFRTGLSTQDLRPIQHLSSLGAPLLIISGADDRHTTWAETQRIFDAAAEPKELWQVNGAAHVDLHAFNPEAYERRILDFLSRHLRDER